MCSLKNVKMFLDDQVCPVNPNSYTVELEGLRHVYTTEAAALHKMYVIFGVTHNVVV